MYQKYLLIILPVFLFSLSGCASTYVPASHQIHMMEGKEEVHIAGNFGNGGFNLQGGVSVSNHFGIVGAYSSSNFALEADEERSHQHYEGGLNYFRRVGERGKTEFIIGIGNGATEAEQWYDRFDRGEYTNIFLQANGSMKISLTEAGVSLRLSNIRFKEFESTRDVSGLKTEDLFFEPSGFISYGIKNIKMESQFGYSFSFNGASKLAFDYEFIRLSLGARIIFNR